MTPDKTIAYDLIVGCFFLLLLIFSIVVTVSHSQLQFGYAPADECANTVKDSMSYIKKQYLINNEPTYKNIRSWCEKNLDDWKPQLQEAMDYEEPPHENFHYYHY